MSIKPSLTDIYIPVSSLAPSVPCFKAPAIPVQIDTITLKFDYTEASMNDILHFLQFQSNMSITYKQTSKSESIHSEIFILSERASLKVMKHFKNKEIYLEFYGLYQYDPLTAKPLNALPLALSLIKEIMEVLPHINFLINKVDINYDTLQDIKLLTASLARELKIKNKTQHPTGVTYGTAKSRYKLIGYAKEAKDNIPKDINRVELTVREKNRISIPIKNIKELERYLEIVKEDFKITLQEGFKKCH